MPKPRKFSQPQARGECRFDEDGGKIVDVSCDIYDDASSSASILGFAKWLTKAAKWLKEKGE